MTWVIAGSPLSFPAPGNGTRGMLWASSPQSGHTGCWLPRQGHGLFHPAASGLPEQPSEAPIRAAVSGSAAIQKLSVLTLAFI